MKKIFYYGLALVLMISTMVSLSSCIDETEPTSVITEEQATSSETAKEAILWGIPSALHAQGVVFGDSYHYDWGYGSMMHIRDRMTGDLTRAYAGGYDWYAYWAYNLYQGPDYIMCQLIWNSYWKFVQPTNDMIKAVGDLATASEAEQGYAAAAYAFRAMLYLDLARMYEFLPNDGTSGINSDGNDVTNLTVPIVDENSTEASRRNNPRVSREKMADFILSDLDSAEKYIPNLDINSHQMPHLDCVYGLKARLYMWLEDYEQAAKYAALAIDESSTTVMTEDDCLNKIKGFNDITKWMWGDVTVKENDATKSSIINWASWMCNETTFGYAGAGTPIQMDASMYKRISDTDFRKNMWAPGKMSNYRDWYETYCIDITNDNAYYPYWGKYESVKFRPANGEMDDYLVGASTAYPLMRVEEMYFIQAEATAHFSAAEGKNLVEKFMKTNRDPNYTCDATSQEDIIDEIVFQKRVELWGEGQTFFDIKRLNMPVTRYYTGTNFPSSAQFNTTTRPAWMNICIIRTEQESNSALVGWNNPDPTGVYE